MVLVTRCAGFGRPCQGDARARTERQSVDGDPDRRSRPDARSQADAEKSESIFMPRLLIVFTLASPPEESAPK
jgi:hypothetical protein